MIFKWRKKCAELQNPCYTPLRPRSNSNAMHLLSWKNCCVSKKSIFLHTEGSSNTAKWEHSQKAILKRGNTVLQRNTAWETNCLEETQFLKKTLLENQKEETYKLNISQLENQKRIMVISFLNKHSAAWEPKRRQTVLKTKHSSKTKHRLKSIVEREYFLGPNTAAVRRQFLERNTSWKSQ